MAVLPQQIFYSRVTGGKLSALTKVAQYVSGRIAKLRTLVIAEAAVFCVHYAPVIA